MWYLYTLSNNGYVFYVGISTNLLSRYKYHCTSRFETTHKYICTIKQDGRLPELTILNTFPSQMCAESAEIALINHFSSISHKLCNDDRNPAQNRLICSIAATQIKRQPRKYAESIIAEALNTFNKTQNYYADKRNRFFNVGYTTVTC